MPQLKNLVVYGKKEINEDTSITYTLQSVSRDQSEKHTIALTEKDNLQFIFADNTTWLCDADTLHELYPEADVLVRPASQRGVAATFELPSTVEAPATERGVVSAIAIIALKVFAKKVVPVAIGEIAKKLENKNLTNIPDAAAGKKGINKDELIKKGAAIFRINKNFAFSAFDNKGVGSPFFLFIHGTNSDTLGAFKELKESAAWGTLFDIYKDNVIAFQHRTLTESPLDNAVKLALLLPDNAELHIISHSRGGIVGDIMNMYSSNNGKAPVGFADDHIALLKKEKGRQSDIKNIQSLNTIFKKKKITVTKFIRVACPAAGTKLASKRLDHILNAFFNIFGGDANPFAGALKDLLTAAVATKDNVNVLPGIEAQSPASPFIKILNDVSEKSGVEGDPLIVVSGNGTFSLSGQGLMVILGKLFYWQRNDLVVNTDSMYLGVKRTTAIQYFFAQDTDVNHVKYFSNNRTREVINLALSTPTGKQIPGFKSVLQNAVPTSDRDDRGLDYGELFPYAKVPSGKKPIVILLPGIMGSNLYGRGKKLWLNYWEMLKGGLINLDYSTSKGLTATSIIKSSYGKLAERLSNSYDVIIYPFDWRRQLNDCAKDLKNKIEELLQLNQPIKIIGHSMGGVLVRDFIINHDDTWQKLNASKDFQLLFLGSPLGGSFRIPAVLFGQDAIINSLSRVDMRHTKKELVDMFRAFPGILSLLPLNTETENDFAESATWKKMRDTMGDNSWPIPSENDLAVFKKYRNAINKTANDIDYSNAVYIAGKDDQTPCGYFNDVIPPRIELAFVYTAEGDQSVTWESGIPKKMAAAGNVYYVGVTHGALANEPDIFNGIEEILLKGSTSLLSKNPPSVRSAEKKFRAPVPVNFDISERGIQKVMFGNQNKKKDPVGSRVPISVTVSNGDLSYASFPVLAGHFNNDGILYAEKVIDANLNGMLSAKHKLGLYPGDIGSNEIFMDCTNNFAGAIIVGIGEAENLTAHQLAKTTEQGVLNYLLSIIDTAAGKNGTGISALLIASGYGGLSVEGSIKAIIEGVNNANEKILGEFKNKCRIIQHLEFIELYSYRALSCMYALNKIVKNENSAYNIVIGNKKIKDLLGVRKRIPLDTSDDWWNRVTVKYKAANENNGEPASMVFDSYTGDAREEENRMFNNITLIDLFIANVSTNNQWSPASAKTLFELMMPNDLKEKLKRKGNITWILDNNTAAYPWELLQDNSINAKPLCINAGMVRQLSTSDYRIKIKRAPQNKALIVADPVLNGFVGQLPGAREEGKVVEGVLKDAGYPVTAIINMDAANVVSNFFSDSYSIIHLAGHGLYNAKVPQKSGMVIGNNIFLSVFDIEQMSIVPQLVFVNCCHLGNINAEDEALYQDRYKLAANIGTQLISIGVKAVVAAGWAVNDAAALDFAKQFYLHMFEGDDFGDAVKKARTYIYDNHPGNNTWGAYQCYGDPFFNFRNVTKTKGAWSPSYIVPEEAEIHLDNLLNELQMGKKTTKANLEELEIITAAVKRDISFTAPIIERQAMIYLEMGMYEKAVERFQTLLKSEKADFSFLSMEKYCNARAKLYVQDFYNDKIKSTHRTRQYIDNIGQVINDLNVLLAAGETAERLNLLGSTYKRKAMLLNNKSERETAYKTAASFYERAALKKGNNNEPYSVTNAIEIGCILSLGGSVNWGQRYKVSNKTYSVTTIQEATKKLAALMDKINKADGSANMDYWDMAAATNIELCMMMINGKMNNEMGWDKLEDDLEMLWKKAGSAGKKIAELEHLQFLIYALSTTNLTATKLFDFKENALSIDSVNHLSAWVIKLKKAFSHIAGKAPKKENTKK